MTRLTAQWLHSFHVCLPTATNNIGTSGVGWYLGIRPRMNIFILGCEWYQMLS